MTSSLDEWQARLHQHFTLLHKSRGSRALFALEHGLDTTDIDFLNKAVRESIRSQTPSRMHSLVWVVYAAEIGYGYSGDEYWQTFEERTPGWTLRGDRGWLRDRFKWFSNTYGGATPSGPWAKQFTIICWPITHAILPRDLQRQLAKSLYELRHLFSGDLFDSPGALGETIAARSWNASTRFQNLAEQPELIGKIAIALLLQGEHGTMSHLHSATLNRITADLDSERMARGWLQTARRIAEERATVRGFSLGRSRAHASRLQTQEAKAEIAALGVEPSLVMRPTDHGWEAFLELPDLSQLLIRFPESREVLTQSRCTVAGSAGRPLARGQCLYGSQRVPLRRWPNSNEVLLKFDKRDLQLEALFRTECLLRPGPQWLFRVASDGLAYEVRNLRVRPGQHYILVHAGSSTNVDLPCIPLTCEGVVAYSLELPQALDERAEKILNQLGLRQRKTIEVWPAGLTPSQWDSEGRGEWLASERPCLGVRADYSVGAIIVSLGGSFAPSLVVNNVKPDEIVFVELPQLPLGLHTIRFSTRRLDSVEVDPVGDLEVLMRIRESKPWSPNGAPQGPILARIEPVSPTLEELWDGTADVSFQGPSGRLLKCCATLLNVANQAMQALQLPHLSLPVDSMTWAAHFRRHFQNQKGIADAYDIAAACELRFAAEELGLFTLRCERQSTPVRWILRRSKKNGYELRLLDDSGDPGPVEVIRRSFEHPQTDERLLPTPAFAIPPAGGMYIAKTQTQSAAILAPPVVEGFAQLGCTPKVGYSGGALASLSGAWSDAELWTAAKTSGDTLCMARQLTVRTALQRYIVRLLCGGEWSTIEDEYLEDKKSIGYLLRAIWKSGHEAEIADRLRKNYSSFGISDMATRIREMAEVAMFLEGPNSRTHESILDWLGEFVLRVMSDPAEVKQWAADKLPEGVSYLLRFPTFARAARFLVIVTDKELKSKSSSHEMYVSWRWR